MLPFKEIRAMYRGIDPKDYNPYPIDWLPLFSPIEGRAWQAIRCLGLPMWPQYPIGKYFADFADPIKKIVIECDGQAYHSPIADAKRDAWMIGEGWMVFRISGADCNRVILPPWEQVERGEIEKRSDEYLQVLEDWYSKTVDGLIAAIGRAFYDSGEPNDVAREVLRDRMAHG